jgi:hypothetical protein
MHEPMTRIGVMAPPTQHDALPLLHCARPPRPGVMTPAASSAELDHALALRTLLWLVATVLGAAELLLLTAPSG